MNGSGTGSTTTFRKIAPTGSSSPVIVSKLADDGKADGQGKAGGKAGETNGKFTPIVNFTGDPPIDEASSKSVSKWLAGGGKSEWPASYGLPPKAVDRLTQIAGERGYGKNLFMTPSEAATLTNGPNPMRKQVVAHRGLFDNSKGIIENSINAAENARTHNFRGIELDLRSSKDGVAFLMHDETIGRVTNDARNRNIADVDSKEFANMPLSIWNPVTNERTPAVTRDGKQQYPETLQSVINYVRKTKADTKDPDAVNIMLDPKDEKSSLIAVEMLSRPENADVRGNIGIKIYAKYMPDSNFEQEELRGSPSPLLTRLRASSEAIAKSSTPYNNLKLIPVLSNLSEIANSVSSESISTQGANWLNGVRTLGDVPMVEVLRLKGAPNLGEMTDTVNKFRAMDGNAKVPITESNISEAISVNGKPFYYSHQGTIIDLPNRPDMDQRRTFGALQPYSQIITSDNPFIEMLAEPSPLKDVDGAFSGMNLNKLAHDSSNPASALGAPPDFLGKPSWSNNGDHRRRLVDDVSTSPYTPPTSGAGSRGSSAASNGSTSGAGGGQDD
ncbi:glycerophosphodiester phosphodiesterase family protein [Rhizobium sp. FKY42]|uniref:glycerophosphodiester phosphodiesterase family protein n=1 Tax=Rhizobium sp. FKY42 TaxID=2562310 RepID=UPI0010C13BE7|nr:glycerophosphodiester phosphodiesterase family protein [Rhizobium sp. FKY42]